MKKPLRATFLQFLYLEFTPALELKKYLLFRIPQIYLLLLSSLLAFSCQSDDSPSAQPDPDWIRLEIPTGREAYAVAGDINKTLLVSTWTKAYYTTDQGKTWQESRNFQGPIMGLLVRNDTTFALKVAGTYQNGQVLASMAQYYTTNYGQSWQYIASSAEYESYSSLRQPVGMVQAFNSLTYQIKNKTTPVSTDSSVFYINPSELQKQDSFGVQTMRLPTEHKLLNLHLDTNKRLYVAASGGTFTKENNLYCCEDNTPAIIYVSRKPLP